MNNSCRRVESLALLLLTLLIGRHAAAEPPATVPSADANSPAPSGSFFSTLRQAFKQDLDKEVVRGHFDLGSPPAAHRYYCLVDAKTGKREDNGVTGQPITGSDGMTRIKAGAVSLYPCADAERQGILITVGYALAGEANSADAPDPAQSDILAVFGRFVAGQNADDRTEVAGTLSDSADFILAQASGGLVRGRDQALDALQEAWRYHGNLEPQLQEVYVEVLAPDAAVLVMPVSQAPLAAGRAADVIRIRWAGIFVKTRTGWRIASIVQTSINTAP